MNPDTNLKLSELENKIKELIATNIVNNFDQRQFDVAYKAVNIEELDLVIENTGSQTIQDYALLKKYKFINKK